MTPEKLAQLLEKEWFKNMNYSPSQELHVKQYFENHNKDAWLLTAKELQKKMVDKEQLNYFIKQFYVGKLKGETSQGKAFREGVNMILDELKSHFKEELKTPNEASPPEDRGGSTVIGAPEPLSGNISKAISDYQKREKEENEKNKLQREYVEELYELNASISAVYIARKTKITDAHVQGINKRLGEIIKKMRMVTE
jgi:molecular chaperone GrpE (heat shock protein)